MVCAMFHPTIGEIALIFQQATTPKLSTNLCMSKEIPRVLPHPLIGYTRTIDNNLGLTRHTTNTMDLSHNPSNNGMGLGLSTI